MLQKLTILALFACAFCWKTAAQDQVKAPKLLILEREEIKPGKVTAHTQAASRFVQLAEKNQAGVYRVGGMAIAGNTNEIFYFSFADSYADYERNVDFPQPMAAELVNLEAQTGDVHNSQRTVIAEFVPALSYRPEAHTAALNNAKRVNLFILRTRPGTYDQVQQIGKLYVDGYKKAGIAEEYWLAYSVRAGMPTDTWIFIEALPSLAALDRNLEERFMKAVGEENLQKIGSISKEAVLSEESFIVGVDPTVSRPTKEMLAANPSWWKAKTSGTWTGVLLRPSFGGNNEAAHEVICLWPARSTVGEKGEPMAQFVKVGTRAELDELEGGKLVEVGGQKIAIFNSGGRYYAIENTCPHRVGPLAEGKIEGDEVICPGS